MNPAYSPGAWSGFGGVTATAAAALVGFLFIAMSINLRQILDAPNRPGRAGLTLVLLATPLVSSLLVLVPGQGRVALGAELLATGVAIGTAQVVLDLRNQLNENETRVTWLVGASAQRRSTPAAWPSRAARCSARSAAACTGWSRRCWWRSSAGCSTSGSCSSRSSASHPPPAIASRVAAI